MSDICPTCGLPRPLCICQAIAKGEQKIKVKLETRKYKKAITLIVGIDEKQINLKEIAKKLKEKGLYLEISDEIGKKLAEDGYDPAFGARPMRRIVDLTLGDLVGKALLSGEIKEGNKIKILPGVGKNEYKVEIVG